MGSEIERSRAPQAVLATATGYDRAVAAFLEQLDGAERTRQTYARALRQYLAFLDVEGVRLEDTTRSHVVEFKRRTAESHSPATVNAYLTAVRGFYAFLEAMGAHPNVAANVKGAHRSGEAGHDALTLEQARRILAEPAEGEAALRNRAMVALMLRRGLRTIEVVRADVGDLRQQSGVAVLFVHGKGHSGKDDFVVLGEECLRAIHDYLQARGRLDDDAPLFAAVGNRNHGGRMTTRSVSRIVKEAYKRHGIADPRLTAHSLRHTAVTLSLVGGATIQEAQSMARHASITTTMIYAHNIDKLEGRAGKSLDALLAC